MDYSTVRAARRPVRTFRITVGAFGAKSGAKPPTTIKSAVSEAETTWIVYTPPYIPRADAAFRSFAEQFATNISNSPAAYGLTPAEAASIMQNLQRFNNAFMVAASPATRTRGTIANKDDARSILKNCISNYSAHIRANLGVTDGDKLSIGVRPRNVAHNRRRCPGTVPLLQFIGSLPGLDQLVYHALNTADSKAKPRGAERLELWVAYSNRGEPMPQVADAKPIGSFRKSKMLVQRDPAFEGMLATYWGRWAGFNDDVGPWSLPCSMALERKKSKTKEAADGDEPLKLAA